MSASIDFPKPSRTTTSIPVPLPLPPVAAVELLTQAKEGIAEAEREADAAQRFATAYLAALRAAAAVLALRGRPHRGRAKPMSVWVLLTSIAPELKEWAAFFASASATRAAVQAGITRLVTTRAADDLVRQADQFIQLIDKIMYEARL
jgi:HEPN domain-containing protein